MEIFSMRNLRHIDISLTKSKGGSFYIKPGHGLGRILIKSITGKVYFELILMRSFEYDYMSDYAIFNSFLSFYQKIRVFCIY